MRTLAALLLVVSLALVGPSAAAQQRDGLSLIVTHAKAPDTTGRALVSIVVRNDEAGSVTVDNVRFSAPEPLVPLASEGWRCDDTGVRPGCGYSGTLAPDASTAPLTVAMTFPNVYGRSRIFIFVDAQRDGRGITVSGEPPVVVYRTFTVTGTADAGAGSLREAMRALAADAVCAVAPCAIEFAIPGAGAGGVQAIRVASPLPVLDVLDVLIDGRSQTNFAGANTNPRGPEIELRGDALAGSGSGLAARARRMEVRDLAIGGFPEHGILFTPRDTSTFVFERNYIGVDATGAVPAPNGLRGIQINAGVVQSSVVRDNVLSGNVRSGMFVSSGRGGGGFLVPSMVVERNRIGLAAHDGTPIPNGASGIYFGPNTDGAAVANNVIAHNMHWGVAVDANARGVAVEPNTIVRNGLGPIDIGLDGPTRGTIEGNVAPTATIDSATWDPVTGTILITGRGPGHHAGYRFIDRYAFYVSNRAGELERHIGSVTPDVFNGSFVFHATAPDLRGLFLTAVTVRDTSLDGTHVYDTSEPTAPVRIE